MKAKTKTTRSGRFLKLAAMTASVASRYANQKVQSAFLSQDKVDERKKETYIKMADDIVATLGDLKGAVMKVGQIASQTQDLLPKEFSDALKKLQKEAPPIEFPIIRKQVETELNAPLNELFKSFSEAPFASASIGQVHKAVTHENQHVVVKVQYPGVDQSCESDLKQLKLTLKLGGLLKLPKTSVDNLFAEIKDRLLEELDYINEAKNIMLFKQFHAKDSSVLIPNVYRGLSTKHILTLEYIEGDHIDDLKYKGYSVDQINIIGQNLFTLLAEHLFVFKHIHGDPHPGNFAFRKDGAVVIYDFGCIKILKPDIVRAYKDAIKASLSEDYDGVDNALMRLGARVNDMASPGDSYYSTWRNIFFEPFLQQGCYNFEDSNIHIKVAKHTHLFFKYLTHFQPPVESLYIDRMIGGHFWLMKSMAVQADFLPILNKYLN